MAYYSPVELLRVLLVRPEIRDADLRAAQQFEDETGRQTYVPADGGWRSRDTQAGIWERSRVEGFRAAPPGESGHEYGAEIDRVIVGIPQNPEVDQYNPLYRRLAEIRELHGLKSGHFFKTGKPDTYHAGAPESLDVMREKWADLKKKILRLPSWSLPPFSRSGH